ncbi:hypothetical protein ACQBAR_11105 [Propionibacteriaceae bacterium Y1685]|uniref:hypothetical protein n=1 Tax=Microlunatus sp. Y1700 TaxID=3418487 RepID=UPI003B7B71CE
MPSTNSRDRARLEPQGAPISTEDVVLRELRVKADPMYVAGAAVRLDAQEGPRLLARTSPHFRVAGQSHRFRERAR